MMLTKVVCIESFFCVGRELVNQFCGVETPPATFRPEDHLFKEDLSFNKKKL